MSSDKRWSATKVPSDVLKRVIATIDDMMSSTVHRAETVRILKSTDPEDVQFYRAMAAGAIKAGMLTGHGPFDVGCLRILDFEIDESIDDFEVIAHIDMDMERELVHIDLRGGRRIIIARKDVIDGIKS